jgi:hypothetical protein
MSLDRYGPSSRDSTSGPGGLEFRATRPEEGDAVRAFLAQVFDIPLNATLVNPRNLNWKYYQRRNDHSGGAESRSFVYTDENGYAAHACAWPFRLFVNGSPITGVHPIDWAAGSAVPGIGALLLRQMRTLGQVSCCIGGTAVAQKVISQTGYRPAGEMKYYSRPLHAWNQLWTHPRRDFKLPARFLRNLLWSHRAGTEAPQDWTADRIAPEQIPSEVLPQSGSSITACDRSPGLFRYLQDCPTALHELYVVRRSGRPAGYFLLSLPPGQARIADTWVTGGAEADWKALYALAVHTAYTNTNAGEVTACSALKDGQNALQSLGFRAHLTLPVMLFDPKKLLADAAPIHFQMIDNDFSFLHQGQPDYQT